MSKIEIGKIVWFLKPVKEKSPLVLGFIRTTKGGAFIIGGPTGSHFTGHGESWEDKLKEINEKGFINTVEACKNGLIDVDWNPPNIEKIDFDFIEKIHAGSI